MTWNLDDIRNGAAATFKAIGLRSDPYVPNTINPPCCFIATGNGAFETFENGASIELKVLVLVGTAETANAQRLLDSFISPSSAKNIDAAVRANPNLTYKGTATVESVEVIGWDEPNEYTIAGITYYGVMFHLQAMVT